MDIIDGNTFVAEIGGKARCVQANGNVVRVFEPGNKIDELVRLNFAPSKLKLKGENILVGGYSLGFDDRLLLTITGKKGVLYSDYSGDATVYEVNKDFSLSALEGHKVEGARRSFSAQINILLGADDRLYGLGDKAAQIDRRGYKFVQWNTDDPTQHNESYKSLYKSINYLLVSGAGGYYGIFYPDAHRVTFDLGAYKSDLLYIGTEGGGYDYFIILGATPDEITRAYVGLVGLPLLPRLKMLGNQQSRWSYASEAEVKEIAAGYKKNGLPLDYIHLDIDYMNGYRVYTVDKSRFPDIKRMSEELKADGIELVTILDPGVKYDVNYSVYNELTESGGLATRYGEIYHNTVWPGDSVYPDYFAPATAGRIADLTDRFMTENGVSGIWCDMNEPASFNGPLPDDVMFGEYEHSRIHNLYGEYMVRAVADAFRKRGERPFIITRACFATTAPFTTVWNGDNQSLWAHLRASLAQIATMSICGFSLDGVDVGGFGGDCNKELLIRWIEANIFSPLLRNHSSINTRSQEPFAFDAQTVEIYKKFLRLRYDIVPYLYDLAYAAHLTGAPIIRPLFYNYPADREAAHISDEIMIGESLLLAPVLDSGVTNRAVYFPAGKWLPWKGINADSKRRSRGYAAVGVPLDSTLLYYRADSIIPMYSGLTNLSKKPTELRLMLGGAPAKCVCYEDDGASVDGRRNEYAVRFDGNTLYFDATRREYSSDYKTLTVMCGEKEVSVPFEYNCKIKI